MSGVEGAEREDYDDGEAGVRKVGRNQARTLLQSEPNQREHYQSCVNK